MSGPRSPQDPPNLLAAVRVTSGPRSPQDPSNRTALTDAGAGAAAPAPAPVTDQKLSLRVEIKRAKPLAISISSPDPMKIEIRKVEIEIYKDKDLVFSTLVSGACDVVVEDASQPHVFPLNPDELKKALPYLRVGNVAVVHVEYLAKTHGEMHVSVVAHSRSHSVDDIVKHVLHMK